MAPKRKQSDKPSTNGVKRSRTAKQTAPDSGTSFPPPFVHAKLLSIRLVLAGGAGEKAEAPIGLEEQYDNLKLILEGTLAHGQGNSALIMGGRGSGKSLLLSTCLRSIGRERMSAAANKRSHYHVTLSAFQQTTDRLALREMARQLVEQGAFRDGDLQLDLETDVADEEGATALTSKDADSVVSGSEGEDDDDEDDDDENEEEMLQAQLRRQKKLELREAERVREEDAAMEKAMLQSLASTTSSILTLLSSSTKTENAPQLSSSSARKPLPLLITLDGFDLFTSRPRQALLYCLLDAVQAGSYTPGLAVIGMSTRLDTIDLLEKRVKSRFSGRIVNTYPPRQDEEWVKIVRSTLMGDPVQPQMLADPEDTSALEESWRKRVESFMSENAFSETLAALIEMSADVPSIYRALFHTVSMVSYTDPLFEAALFAKAAIAERTDSTKAILQDLTKPEYALLIAATHLRLRDRPIFNFEMALDEIRRFEAANARDGDAAWNSAMSGNAVGSDATIEGGMQGEYVPIGGKKRAQREGPLGNRKTALLAFQTLITLELFIPHVTLSTLSALAPGIHGSTSRGVQPQFVRVTCAVLPGLVKDGVKDPARREVLGTELEKWALRDVVPTH